jgi:hypothetical protein
MTELIVAEMKRVGNNVAGATKRAEVVVKLTGKKFGADYVGLDRKTLVSALARSLDMGKPADGVGAFGVRPAEWTEAAELVVEVSRKVDDDVAPVGETVEAAFVDFVSRLCFAIFASDISTSVRGTEKTNEPQEMAADALTEALAKAKEHAPVLCTKAATRTYNESLSEDGNSAIPNLRVILENVFGFECEENDDDEDGGDEEDADWKTEESDLSKEGDDELSEASQGDAVPPPPKKDC